MAVAHAAEELNGYTHRPTDSETLSMYVPESATAQQVNEHILNHPLSQALRADPKYSEARPHVRIPPAQRNTNFTGGTLHGDGKIVVLPVVFANESDSLPSLVSISYLGESLCGHAGIIHGGLLATLLDEGLARACFPALPNKVGVTASLKIDYRRPCPADSYIVLKAETTKVDGRKAWVKGWIELLGEGTEEGEKLVEAEALFIEPKAAKNMARIYTST